MFFAHQWHELRFLILAKFFWLFASKNLVTVKEKKSHNRTTLVFYSRKKSFFCLIVVSLGVFTQTLQETCYFTVLRKCETQNLLHCNEKKSGLPSLCLVALYTCCSCVWFESMLYLVQVTLPQTGRTQNNENVRKSCESL